VRENFDAWARQLTDQDVKRIILPAVVDQIERKFGEENRWRFVIDVKLVGGE
jgi:hypothetical protein